MEAISPSEQELAAREDHRLGQFLEEIRCLENANKVLKEISPSINEAVVARILWNFHSATAMCSPQGCSQLLEILDRLEEQVFGEGKETLRLDDARTSYNSYDSFDPTQGSGGGGGGERALHPHSFSVFDHQHPPTPVSTSTNSATTLRSPLPASSPDFRHSGGGGAAGGRSYSLDDDDRHDDRSSRDLEASKSVCFRRAVRKLEASFVECSPSSPGAESSGSVFGRFEFFHAHGKKVSRGNSGSSGDKKGKRSKSGSRSADSFDVFQGSSTSCSKNNDEFVLQRRHFSGRGAGFIPSVTCKPSMPKPISGTKLSDRSIKQQQQQQRSSPTLSSAIVPAQMDRSKLVKGSLQCMIKDGSISYNLWLDETEELIVAKPASQDITEDQELCDQVFVFYSYKCRGRRERAGWRQWGKREKPVTEIVGKMKIFSTVMPEMDRGGRNRHYLDSDFVLFEARGGDQAASSSGSPRQHLAACSSRRLSFSSWDATPSESPGCVTSSSSGSPRAAEKSGTGTPVKNWASVGFLKNNKKESSSRMSDSVSAETGSFSARASFVEVAAVATRVPIGVRKQRSTGQLSSWESRLKRNAAADDLGCDKINATVVLPAGEHGCPAYGLPGPQPLLERWRGGGKCDCGSWDLGCGLVLLESQQQSSRCSAQEQAGCVSVVNQAKKHEVALRLTPLYDDDTFAVSFQQPLSTFQAFATAVALLHSRKKPPPIKLRSREEEGTKPSGAAAAAETAKISTKKSFVLPKLLLRGSSFHEAMSLTGIPKIRRVYSLGCRPEPLSLVERV